MSDIRQMKLFSGEEILCDLVDVQNEYGDEEVFIIRAAYLLISKEDFENNMRYYTFRPFMMHILDPSHVLLLNSASVICITNPHTIVLEQYVHHCALVRNEMAELEQSNVENHLDKMAGEDAQRDNNVVDLKPKVH
tara:strand:- start:6595 stop:7002 length:408 start_codon:yes stop_codon:yes gene_type:complete